MEVNDMEKKYESEAEFLKHYNPDAFEKLSLTADILMFSVSDGEQENYRKLNEKHFSVLLVKRDDYPFKDKWCLPGGFVQMSESIDDAAIRILAHETNLHHIYMEQLYTYGDPKRDPRMRIVSTAYMALVDKNRLDETLSHNASWFHIHVLEDDTRVNLMLENGFDEFHLEFKKTLKKSSTEQHEYEVIQNDALAFDHAMVIVNGMERLKNKITYTDIVFHMMPTYFTLGELQQVYEIILGKKLLDPAFRRIIANKVEKTDKVKTGGGQRPSALFKYKNR